MPSARCAYPFVGLLLVLITSPASGQLPAFGSYDDPREQRNRFWWEREQVLDLMGGFSLIGAQWRTAAGLTFTLDTPVLTARLSGTLRAGIYGTYRPDLDEPYDLLRLLEYARYRPTPAARLYARLGPLQRLRLGTGHLVDFLATDTAWDERTVGIEARWWSPALDVAAFTGDVRFDGLIGGRVGMHPLVWTSTPRTRSLYLGLSYVTDRAPSVAGLPRLEAFALDASLDVMHAGAFTLTPFASYARYLGFGEGLQFGARLFSDNFIDLGRLHARLTFFLNGTGFIPGYVNAFYPVNNLHARILRADDPPPNEDADPFAGIRLDQSAGGDALMSEVRLLLFSGFEFYYAFRRHYGSQALSTLHLRLYLRARRFSFYLGQDRGGLRGFLTLFNDLGDLSALDFQTDYRFAGDFRVYVRARYTYERLEDGPDGTARFLVQRRFEPFVGLRTTF